ncbi:hypothetical protein AVEN_220453-1 [Araneus ventricosus]|uniref:Uncharacterized protein n=1 Tax=Araneus ventricosus TaxID=182803 RepID=A0A4Y2MFI9_ARAVE|nr:hypothetical protein AVEN_220453-1 [Araneus ventricosus]
MQKEECEEWMFIDEEIPVAVTLTDLEICQAICEQVQAIKVADSDGDECVEENPPTNDEMRQFLDILNTALLEVEFFGERAVKDLHRPPDHKNNLGNSIDEIYVNRPEKGHVH